MKYEICIFPEIDRGLLDSSIARIFILRNGSVISGGRSGAWQN
jgi:hypothetical protein